ncbi:MAG: DUF4392 domain-containing protein [Halohasta sp.]
MFAAIDHLITFDPGGRNSRALYAAARGSPECDDRPLVEQAAEQLLDAISPGSTVAIATGFPITAVGRPETDGPLGAVVLGRALATLGARPVFLVEPALEPAIDALAAELGLDSPTIEPVEPSGSSEPAASETPGLGLLDRDDPAAVVAVEKPGRTADGTYRNMAGEDVSGSVGSVDGLFDEAADRGIPTVAVGDGGNEIGMGSIQEAVEREIDHGGTIACVQPADALVVAGVSNWGAYGIVAGLSVLSGQELLHTGRIERSLLDVCVSAGCVDGVTARPTPSVDGIPGDRHAHVVDLLFGGVTAFHARDGVVDSEAARHSETDTTEK